VGRLFYWVLSFKFSQVLAHGSIDLSGFGQLVSRDAALLAGIGFYESPIHGQLVSMHQSNRHALSYHLLKQLLEQLRFLKAPVAILGKRGVMRNFFVETKPCEPTPRKVHA